MILNLVQTDTSECIKLFLAYRVFDDNAQLFLSSRLKCSRYMAISGVVFSNNRIGNGRDLTNVNFEDLSREEGLSKEAINFLRKEIQHESIYPNAR